MRILDLFCGAGGASKGYADAGFEVTGVDINPQPNFPFRFIQGDALASLGRRKWLAEKAADQYDAIHASPPCQAFTVYQNNGKTRESPDLIEPTRALLNATGLPYVIENVTGAPLHDPVLICGSMLDMDIQRHRLFETNWPLEPPVWPCRHKIWGPDRYPGGRSKERTGTSRGLVRGTVEVGTWDIPLTVQQQAMGIDWMTTHAEISEAIPPAYTEHIGHQLAAYIRQEVLV